MNKKQFLIFAPLVLLTGYKKNGTANGTMQLWFCFSSETELYCIFGREILCGRLWCPTFQNHAVRRYDFEVGRLCMPAGLLYWLKGK